MEGYGRIWEDTGGHGRAQGRGRSHRTEKKLAFEDLGFIAFSIDLAAPRLKDITTFLIEFN